MSWRLLIGLVLLSVTCHAAGGFSQIQQIPVDPRQDVATKLHVVRSLLRDDPATAIRLLRDLAASYPTDARILVMLGETFQSVGEIDSARVVYERCLRIDPVNLQAGTSLGVLYLQRGERPKSRAVFDDMLERTAHNANTYRTIASALSSSGYVDEALSMYRTGRERNKNSYFLMIDIAHLEKSMGDYEAALAEYLSLVDEFPKQYRLAKDKIMELFDEPAADGEKLITFLRGRTETSDARRAEYAEILAFAYLREGRLESALEMALEADRAGMPDGAVLYSLGEEAMNTYRELPPAERARYFDLSLRACEAYLEKYAKSPMAPRAKLMLTDLLVDAATGRIVGESAAAVRNAIPRALESLDEVIAAYSGTEHAEKAYLRKGDIVFRLLKQPERAIEIYQTGSKAGRMYRSLFAERLGRTYLLLDRHAEARTHFEALIRSRNQELQETGIFYTGLLLVFTGRYEEARDTLVALAEGNPSSPLTNDAIQLSWAIEEGLRGQQAVLADFIAALKAEVADDTTTVISRLKEIAALPPAVPLRSRSLVKLAEMYQGSGRYEEAVRTCERFIADYPADVQLPEMHRRVGQVYEYGYGKPDIALQKYEHILLSYPYYMFLDEVRADVMRLRQKLKEKS